MIEKLIFISMLHCVSAFYVGLTQTSLVLVLFALFLGFIGLLILFSYLCFRLFLLI
ncbi:hypothetical protein LCDV1gp027 [Lymphocystis disease virus 1]|uniref:hypothetical protein n=1 Tax=Fish lymphocystis disease virus TaxID=36363 RepID=UPI0000161F07|nr:hypothetical protein LCDV1gp027 [Lymphocystis disease virus 1]